MSIRHAILGLLAGGPMHGYDLKAAFEGELAPGARLNYGQVYSTLERLQKDVPLITPEVVAGDRHPDRIVYSLTDAGRRELQSWLDTPVEQDIDPRNETFLKLMVARRLHGGAAARGGVRADPRAVLAAERRACLETLREVQEHRAAAEREGRPVATTLLLDLAVLRLDAFHRWLEHCDEVLAKGDRA